MTPKMQLLAYSALMGVIILSAYLGIIPTKLHDIPFYDSAGHFALYGLWGYFFGNAFPTPVFSVRTFSFQAGILYAILIATTEEFLQQRSAMRSFSLADLAFDLAGIVVACIVLNFRDKPKQ